MKETTSTQLQQGYAFSRTMDYVIQSGPVKLKCTQRPDIVIVSANDYEEMKLNRDEIESKLRQVNYINEQLKTNLMGVITLYKDEKGIPLHISESSKFENYRLSQADCYLAELNKPPTHKED